ncbi:MAG: cryptochrome/photolyase family protein [Opitutaceae bacterium]|nr:cryptochrome/photolyase family protein [Opitutaceae bacterium]
MRTPEVRHLIVVLGDQLDLESAAFDGFDPSSDMIWMAEVAEESIHVWSSKIRIVLFLAAMRHFRKALLSRQGWRVDYSELDAPANKGNLADELDRAIKRLQPARVIMVEAGDFRVEQAIVERTHTAGVEFELREDRHFYASRQDFIDHTEGRKSIRLEYFYRELRRRENILVTDDGKPEGGQWNYDAENRKGFGKTGPKDLRAPRLFKPDAITREVIDLVEDRFADHPGDLGEFSWPVTALQAQHALEDFVEHRLKYFGKYQDAMWENEPWLFHSRISAAMNLKLLNPRAAVDVAVAAYRKGDAPLASVEGFVRQILGWREYVRGVYWWKMPGYAQGNALQAKQALPKFYWTGHCEMNCLRQAIGQTLQHGHAHHIQRLMVTGLYSLLLGVKPKEIHEWYLAVYVDAVEWVELPNTIGMSQFADGGLMASKPYVATGKYIQRMSNYCKDCRFDPAHATGDQACPFTTLYWDFLERHADDLRLNRRMQFQLKNLERKSSESRKDIAGQAKCIRRNGGQPSRPDNELDSAD